MEHGDYSFNLNLLECKYGFKWLLNARGYFVLISTYWNVNAGTQGEPPMI